MTVGLVAGSHRLVARYAASSNTDITAAARSGDQAAPRHRPAEGHECDADREIEQAHHCDRGMGEAEYGAEQRRGDCGLPRAARWVGHQRQPDHPDTDAGDLLGREVDQRQHDREIKPREQALRLDRAQHQPQDERHREIEHVSKRHVGA